ncbi:hypothetical protein A6S26_13820 [Nostoc sp. ATCC 43529]|nr:hypothetical protein A6S26_13820 [Nostoc sp. ATCC 43529]
MNSKINKFVLTTVAGSVVGFSIMLGSFETAFASQSIIITSPVKQAISNVVLYLQNSSGNIIKVKIDNFSAVQETKTYDPTSVLQKYSDYTLVAYTVKAGNNKLSDMGSGEGELFIIPDSGIQQSQLPTYNTTDQNTYQYKDVYSTSNISSSNTTTSTTTNNNISTTTSSVDNSVNTVNSETSGDIQSAPVNESTVVSYNNAETTKPVSVPEPGTITAIALFGLGSLFTKKKLTSSSK